MKLWAKPVPDNINCSWDKIAGVLTVSSSAIPVESVTKFVFSTIEPPKSKLIELLFPPLPYLIVYNVLGFNLTSYGMVVIGSKIAGIGDKLPTLR